VSHNYLQEPLEPFPPVLNNIIGEAVGEDLARKRRDGYAGRFALKDISEVFKVGVPAADRGGFKLERWYICPAYNLVVGVHFPADTMGLRVLDLDLKKVLRWAVDLVEALRPGGLDRSLHLGGAMWASLFLICTECGVF